MTMWFNAVGCILALTLSLLTAPRAAIIAGMLSTPKSVIADVQAALGSLPN
jgi:hypothetical protein